jgi:copper(I)-binding protein
MLIGLNNNINIGEKHTVTLELKNNGIIDLSLEVKN